MKYASPNPFAQSPSHYAMRFSVPAAYAMGAVESFDDVALSSACVENEANPSEWLIELVFDHAPDEAEIEKRVGILAEALDFSMPAITCEKLERQDWVTQVAQQFPPFHVGKFYIHGSHVAALAPHGSIPLQVDAGTAFGSGEHATTSGCLLALQRACRKNRFPRVLDMGAGTAILGIASAKLHKNSRTLAIDIDPVAVEVARMNACVNRVNQRLRAYTANGYNSPLVAKAAPYDLIFANILARPLTRMSRALESHLAPGGVAILSGLLNEQARFVLAAHRMHGLALRERIRIGDWCTLVVEKRA